MTDNILDLPFSFIKPKLVQYFELNGKPETLENLKGIYLLNKRFIELTNVL